MVSPPVQSGRESVTRRIPGLPGNMFSVIGQTPGRESLTKVTLYYKSSYFQYRGEATFSYTFQVLKTWKVYAEKSVLRRRTAE